MEHNYETNRLNELRDAIKQEENVIQTTKQHRYKKPKNL